MAKKLIPDYDFSLGATSQQQKGSIQSLYDKISENEKSIYAKVNAPKIGGAGGLNYYDIERNFVKKRGDDVIYGNISVDAELKSTGFNENTNGWRLSKDSNGKGRLDIDDIYVRNSITTQILTYEKINATGGSLLLSSAWCTVESSEVLGTGSTRVIRIYYKPDGYNIQRWMEYDQAIIKSGLDKYLMSVVTSVSTTPDADGRFWIELYYGGGASGAIQPYYEQEGVYIPVAGDVVVQYGYRKSDAPSRQNIIKISVGDGLNSFPYIEQYRGINSFDFNNKLITRISDDVYFGNGDQSKYIWWNKDDNSELLLKGTLVQSPTGATMPNVFWRGYYSAAETYYRGDLVQYLGVNYISIYDGAHSQNTPPNPTYWEIFVDKGAEGNSAKLITLVASTQIINESELGTRTPSEITVSSIVQNTRITDWYFSVDGNPFSVLPPAGVVLSYGVVTITTSLINFITLSIKATDRVVSDTVTISRTTDGAGNILVDLSNQSHTIVCDSDGVPLAGELNFAKTLVNVYRGTTLLTLGTDWEFQGETASSGISYNIIGNEVSVTAISPSVNSGYIDLDIEASPDLIVSKRFSIAKSKNGGDGGTGSEGTGYQTIYTSTANKDTYPTYINPSANYLSEGWSDTPTGVGPLMRAQWRSIRVSIDGVWGNFSTAALDSTYSADGEAGKDGLYVKYIYKRTQTPTAPAAPSDAQNWAVDGWTDDPMGVTPEYPYEFISYSQYDPNTGLYGAWSTPKEWSRYAFSGMAIRFTRWQVGVMYYDGTYSAGNPLRYKDYVVDIDYAGVVRAYECISEHLSFWSGRPTLNDAQSNELWSNISYQPAIATDVLLANQAVIGGFMFSAAMENFNAIDPINQYLRTTDSATNPSILMKGDGYASFAKGKVKFFTDGNAEFDGVVNAKGGKIDGVLELSGGIKNENIEVSNSPIETLTQLATPQSETLTSRLPLTDSGLNRNVSVQVTTAAATFEGLMQVVFDADVSAYLVDGGYFFKVYENYGGTSTLIYSKANTSFAGVISESFNIPTRIGRTYTVNAYTDGKIQLGNPDAYSEVSISGSTTNLVNIGYHNKTKLSNQGLYSWWAADNYMYFSSIHDFSVRKGNYGISIDSNGIYKWESNNWVPINYIAW